MFQIHNLSFLTALMVLVATAHAQTGSSLEKMGGSITDAETQNEIFLSCTELNQDQICLSYQYYFKTGEIKLPLSKKLLPADFKAVYDSFKQKITTEMSKIDQTAPHAKWKLNLFILTRKTCSIGSEQVGGNAFEQSYALNPYNNDERATHARIGTNLIACMALGLVPILGQVSLYTASWITMPIDISVAAVKTPVVLLRNALVAIKNRQIKKDDQKTNLKLITAIKNTYDQKSQTILITHDEFNVLKSIIETELKQK